jgi:hypothetical protein
LAGEVLKDMPNCWPVSGSASGSKPAQSTSGARKIFSARPGGFFGTRTGRVAAVNSAMKLTEASLSPRGVRSVQGMLHNRNKLQPYGENAKNSLYFFMGFAHEQSSSGLGEHFHETFLGNCIDLGRVCEFRLCR